jgi:hypothetical protein
MMENSAFFIFIRKFLAGLMLGILLLSGWAGTGHVSAQPLSVLPDDAILLTQTPSPRYLMVKGSAFQIHFTFKNTGTNTWQPGSYWLQNKQLPLGAGTVQPLSGPVAMNGQSVWSINMMAPTTAGTYRTIWRVSHNGVEFGPTVYLDLVVLDYWAGSVQITSNRPVLAVGRPHVGAEVASYNGAASGSLTAYVPMLFKNAWGSYNAALYVQNVDPTPGHTANITITYYDSAGNQSCAPQDDTVASLASKPYWLPSVSCLPDGWVGGAVITSSDYPIVAVGRPHVGPEVMTYNGFSSGSLVSYLPMLFKNAWSAYDAAFYVQNVDADPAHTAHITINYYDSTGNPSCPPQSDTVPPLASKGYWLPSVECLSDGWVGGAVITSSDYPIVAVGRPHIGTQVTTYAGMPGGSSSMYVPMLFKNAFGGSYVAAFYVQNVDPDPAHTANITINYYDSLGNQSCATQNDTVAPLASKGYWLPSVGCLPDGWVGGAVITSNYPIVAVGRPHVGAQVTTYPGMAGGSSSLYLPMLFRNAWGLYNSAFYVQNTDAMNDASVTVKFYTTAGYLACTRSDTIRSRATQGYWVPSVTCDP